MVANKLNKLLENNHSFERSNKTIHLMVKNALGNRDEVYASGKLAGVLLDPNATHGLSQESKYVR